MAVKCKLCAAPTDEVLLEGIESHKRAYSIIYCRDCKAGFTHPFPAQKVLDALYSTGVYRANDGRRFNPIIEIAINYFRNRHRKRITSFVKRGHILDIGCGRGFFLHSMKENGWCVTGVELNSETAAYAKNVYGITVMTQIDFPDGSFDVITLNHVLEHFPDPRQLLARCHRMLKSGGLLVVAVPNIGSLQAAAGKKLWFHLDVPFHLFHYTEAGLISMMRGSNFTIVRTRRFDLEHNLFGWLQTMLNLSGIRKNLFYNLLKMPLLRRQEIALAKKTEIFSTLALLPLYAPLAFLLTIVEFLLKRTGTIEVYALKSN